MPVQIQPLRALMLAALKFKEQYCGLNAVHFESRVTIAKSWLTNWPRELSLFLIPTSFALLQGWTIQRIAMQFVPRPLLDGKLYITQALQLQQEPFTPLRFLEFGLYPLLLSQFDVRVRDWVVGGNGPNLLAVYYTQSIILCAMSAIFLSCAFILTSGHLLKRTVISALLGGILLSPLVIVWPTTILTEALALPTMLLFACACLSDNSGRSWSPIFIAIVCCLLVLVRDAMLIFVCIFGALFLANTLFVKVNRTGPRMTGMVLVLLAIGLGGSKAWLVESGGSKNLSQLLANIVQLRILPHPESRNFFAERGLPISSTVMERSGLPAWDDNDWYEPDSAVSDRPAFIAYRHWIVTKGPKTYLTFLLTHPWYLLRSIVYSPDVPDARYMLVQDIQFSITDLFSRPYIGYQTPLAPYPQWLSNFLLAPFGWFIPLLYFTLVTMRYIWQTATQRRASSLDVAAIAAGGAIFVNYQVDAWGIWAHSVPFVLLIYIALIIGTAKVAKGLAWIIRFPTARTGLPFGAGTLGAHTDKIREGGIPTLLSTGARLNAARVVAFSIVCVSIVWASHNYFAAVKGSWQVASSNSRKRYCPESY